MVNITEIMKLCDSINSRFNRIIICFFCILPFGEVPQLCYNLTMVKQFTLCALLAVSVMGCRPMATLTVDPSGPPEYQLGWEDGCDTGIAAQGAWYYKYMYGFKKRTELAANDQYKQGWNEGFTFCRFAQAKSDEASEWEHIGLGDGF